MVITYGEKIRAKLDKKIFQSEVFDPKTVTISSQTSASYNEEDELVSNAVSQGTTVAVPYDLIQNRFSANPWGLVKEGESQIAFRYNTVIDVNDIVTIESINYKVVDIDPNYLKDPVVKICTLSRITG